MTMLYKLRDLIPSPNTSTPIDDGGWVRAMHEPFSEGLIGRIGSAFAVLTGRAVAVEWPQHGEFEDAMRHTDKDRQLHEPDQHDIEWKKLLQEADLGKITPVELMKRSRPFFSFRDELSE
jgi:hypothetical protein